MKRFWTGVSVVDGGVLLDGKPVRTPGRLPLVLRTPQLAEAVAAEWRAVDGEIDPRAMRLTGLANAAIERIAPAPEVFAAGLASYAETDLLCYRADEPAELVARQAAMWDPPLDWARGRYDVHFTIATGIVHQAQPPATVTRLAEALGAQDAWTLAALSPIVTLTGSLVLALALAEAAIDPDAAWDAAELDATWQAERWGQDAQAAEALAARRVEYDAAVAFLRLI
jgi:chaperone required for assembly of F1-ATPase